MAGNRKRAEERDLEEIKRLQSSRSDYDAKVDDWQFMLRSYEGGFEYVGQDTLFTHTREHKDDYAARLKRAHFQNYCQPIVDFVPDFIYQSPIERQPDAANRAAFGPFVKNVNRAGADMQEFMRDVAEDARTFGHVWVEAAKPAVPEGVDLANVSLAQARQLNLMPYFVKVLPTEVLDWVIDENGTCVYIKRKQTLDILIGRKRQSIERYTEYYVDYWKVTDVNVDDEQHPKIVDTKDGENTLGQVPYVFVPHKRSKTNSDFGKSAIADIAYQNRDVFNLTSLIGEFLYRQAFNILAVATVASVPSKGAAVEEEVGAGNIFEYPAEAKHPPAYLAPSPEPAEFIQKERAETIQSMYRQAAQDISAELFAGSNRSGDASKQAFGRQAPTIARFADVLQLAEQKLFQLWAKMQRREWTGKIAYKDDYAVTNFQDLILQFTSIFRDCKVLSPTFIREEWKRLVREFDGKIEHGKMEKIVAEIEKISDDKIIDLIKNESANGKAMPGVPSRANQVQAKHQQGSTDRRRSLQTGDRSSSKESVPDRNRRTK